MEQLTQAFSAKPFFLSANQRPQRYLSLAFLSLTDPTSPVGTDPTCPKS